MQNMRAIRGKIGGWSDLPVELLRCIAKFLRNNTNDLRTFRLVCKSWLRSTSISEFLPYREINSPSDSLYSSSVYLLRPRTLCNNAIDTPWMVCAVEITKGNIQLCHPFTLAPYTTLVQHFDIADQFHPTLLTESYHIAAFDEVDCFSVLSGTDKVLVFPKKPLATITDCSLLVLLHGRLGGMHSLIMGEKEWVDISLEPHEDTGVESDVGIIDEFDDTVNKFGEIVDEFDDIVSFKGVMYAIDWGGKLYKMDTHKTGVSKTLIDQNVSNTEAYKGRRMRLVGSSSDGNLYLLLREQDMIKVYQTYKSDDESWSWVKVEGFQVEDQVLFVTRNFCFFTSASKFPGCNLSNCIIFSEEAFPVYCVWGWVSNRRCEDQEEIWIVQLGGHGDHKCQPSSSFPGFPVNLWSPPQSVLRTHTLLRENANSQLEEHIKPSLISNEAALPCQQFGYQMQDLKCTNCLTSKVDFEGVYIRSDFVPTLQKVWEKYGNIVEGSSVHSKGMLACTLESLAKVINMLQSSSGRTLTKLQCDYINSVLMDLLQVRLKVEWLFPLVEKAMAFHQSKIAIGGLTELDLNIALCEEEKERFVEELVTMDEVQNELKEEKQLLSEKIPIKEHDHLDQCIGADLRL